MGGTFIRWISQLRGLYGCRCTFIFCIIFPADLERGYTCTVPYLEWFLDHGADVNQADDRSTTALNIAAFDANIDSLKVLINRGANLECGALQSCTRNPNTPFTQWKEVMDFLLSSGSDINAGEPPPTREGGMYAGRRRDYGTVLHEATKYRTLTHVRYLLNRGADPRIESKWGRLARDWAKDRQRSKFIAVLDEATDSFIG
ncbi:ankyrin [Tothia fuscella]|uniref:Ankyrin n=1 Tax=Tothia fuscella TaxID=1048955 RepID=A0A9P4NG74_9PEZI|nr:ankyrin [Tothia fuscella]